MKKAGCTGGCRRAGQRAATLFDGMMDLWDQYAMVLGEQAYDPGQTLRADAARHC